jgi:hypothetical protein
MGSAAGRDAVPVEDLTVCAYRIPTDDGALTSIGEALHPDLTRTALSLELEPEDARRYEVS